MQGRSPNAAALSLAHYYLICPLLPRAIGRRWALSPNLLQFPPVCPPHETVSGNQRSSTFQCCKTQPSSELRPLRGERVKCAQVIGSTTFCAKEQPLSHASPMALSHSAPQANIAGRKMSPRKMFSALPIRTTREALFRQARW